MMVFLMYGEMSVQVVDARGEQRNLYFRRTCVAFVRTEFFYNLFFLFF